MSQTRMRPAKLAKWGNSSAIRLAAATLKEANFSLDDPVDVSASDGEIVIRRQAPRASMDELLSRFDPEKHRHDLAFDHQPVGSETR